MKTYSFKAVNWVLFILIGILAVLGGILTTIRFIPEDTAFIIIISYMLGLLAIASYFVNLTAFAKVEITLNDDAISIKWLEQFLFHSKRDVVIPFSEIKSYVVDSDGYWYWVSIKTTDGKKHRIWHYERMFFRKKDNDAYREFVFAFISSVENYNRATKHNDLNVKAKEIKEGRRFDETIGGLIFSGLLAVLFVGGIIAFLIFPTYYPVQWWTWLVCAIGLITAFCAFIQGYKGRKMKKNDD